MVLQPGPTVSDFPPDTESDSSEIGDSDQSADEAPSTETRRTPMHSRPNRVRPQRIRKPPGWLMTGQWASQFVQ